MKRERVCTACGRHFSASQKKALEKHKYCSHQCFLQSRTSQQMAAMARGRAKHSMYRTRIYRIWGAMKQRCLNPNSAAYRKYGAVGVTIDPCWHSFEHFYADMGATYRDGLTLDRIDGTKGYSKDNCRWATRAEQSANLKSNVLVDCNGEVLCVAACARKLRVNPSTISARIYQGKLTRVWKRAA